MNENINNNETNENIIENENINSNEIVNNSYEDANQVVSENIMINEPNIDGQENLDETVSFAVKDTNFTEVTDEKVKKNKGGMRNRVVSYVLVGAICSILAGTASGLVTMNMMKNSNAINTPKSTNTTVSTNEKAKLITTNSTEILSIPAIVKKVSSSVVAISTKSSSVSGRFGGQATPTEGVGTGIIWISLTDLTYLPRSQTCQCHFRNRHILQTTAATPAHIVA